VRNLNGVSDADVAHARHVLTDSNGVAPLFDRRVRERDVQALLWIVKAETRGRVLQRARALCRPALPVMSTSPGRWSVQPNGPVTAVAAIERAANRRSAVAARQDKHNEKDRER